MTVRQALQKLRHEGLIYHERGIGTFVNNRKIDVHTRNLNGFSEEMISLGLVPSSRVLTFEENWRPMTMKENLQLGAGAEVVHLERLRLADGEAMAFEQTFLPAYLFPKLEEFDLTKNSLYQVLNENYDLEMHHAEEIFEAKAATRFVAQQFGIRAGTAVLVVHRVVFSANLTSRLNRRTRPTAPTVIARHFICLKIPEMKIKLVCLFLLCLTQFTAHNFAQNASKLPTKILLIPLDDRPPCLQFPVRMGLIGDAQVVAPPVELLGKFTEPGKSDEIIKWIKQQDLKSFDAAIISVDMLAYGGLVAMRVHDTDDQTALKRLAFLKEMRKLAPQLKIYGSSVIMRLAPTGTGANEAYRANLAQWAEISVDPNAKMETSALENKIPAEALANYKAARVRDLKINRATVDLVRDKTIDYLILSQDDAKPKGIHVADRENLIAMTKKLKLTEKIAVQPGADEVSMLLLARSLSDKYDFHPSIKVVYSSEEAANSVMPFEDRPLRQTVGFHIKAVGGREAADEKAEDVLFYVYASRFVKNSADKFAAEIKGKLDQNKQVIVADVDPKGDVQGGDFSFTAHLAKQQLLPRINSYAAWNTAGNTIGTTLPQGVIFALAKAKLLKSDAAKTRILTAQNWFTFHRVLDDYYFHNIVRAKAKNYIAQNKWNAFRLSDEATGKVEDYSLNLLKDSFAELFKAYFLATLQNSNAKLICEKPTNLTFDLPWNRTFEADINFELQCRLAAGN